MKLRTATRIRVLVTALILTATAVYGLISPQPGKNASGCSLVEDARPGGNGCVGMIGSNCYECLHSDPFGFIECFESPDGGVIYCRPFQI